MRTLYITPPNYSILVRLRGGLRLRVFEGPDGRGRAYWARLDGWVVRWIVPPVC